ncbi:unnamed protein product [Adineta steineri]|uniref:G-protein coupled receptors family 1 profile domain-containing protein n=1 Tax=Adineta steineri TaxID=433720 RepID=A0A818V9W1_9BILA|nr:unnamed protein product [Adineta steineri]CAF0811941.1 unnamed protein product [Adineta steineri]CAF3709078.1 unnamed protein product [Adineta steineri]CAF3958182.1 unnamed protein product [Adineta steineri]
MNETNESSSSTEDQHQNIYSDVNSDTLLLTIESMIEAGLNNVTNDSTSHLTYDFALTSLTYTIIFGFVCALLCFLTIVGNLLVLITFRRMRTVGNLFILSLATADLIVGCFVMPIAGIYAITEKWNMSLILCQIWISVDFIASTASIFNLLTLSLDRYWSITSPLQYLGKRTRTRALLLIGFAWGLSLLWIIPIFGWHHFNNGIRQIEDGKCEPEYTHSKVFKVSTAIINFYLPLLVLISLNGRIYYEIKRRYRSVLLQRHSNKLNESITTTNNNNHNNHSLYTRKLNQTSNHSRSPVTVTLCDSDRQLCSSTIHYTENDSLVIPKSPVLNNESVLRINFKAKKFRPAVSKQLSGDRKLSLKRAYSYIDNNHCTQDELTWFAHRRDHCHNSFTQTSPIILSTFKYNSPISHRNHTNECSSKHTNDHKSNKIYSNKQKIKRNLSNPSLSYKNSCYQTSYHNTTVPCHRCSLLDSLKLSSSTPPTTMNIFNLCHCCSAATSAITIHSNHFVNSNATSNSESYKTARRLSSSSSSSIAPSLINRKQPLPILSYSKTKNTVTTNSITRSNSQSSPFLLTNKVKQATVWNQQEKAFRQLFAIVFGFTCCFLPYFIIYMVVAFCGSCISERVVTATIWLGYVNSTINPFLYALSNKHFRRTFNRLIKRDNRRQIYYN